MNDIIKGLKELESMDGEYFQLKEQTKKLPAALATRETECAAHNQELQRRTDELKQLAAREDLLTREVAEITVKVKALEKKVFSMKRLDEVEAIEKEKDFLINTRVQKEQETLTVMEDRETMAKELPEYQAANEKLNQETAAFREKTAAEQAAINDRLSGLETKRESIKKIIPAPIYRKYEKIFNGCDGHVLALITDTNGCSGCGFTLRPQIISNVKTGKKIVECESCARILYLDKNGDTAAPA